MKPKSHWDAIYEHYRQESQTPPTLPSLWWDIIVLLVLLAVMMYLLLRPLS